MKKNKLNKGFALSGAMVAWALGLMTLLGGGAYATNSIINNSSDKDHSFVPSYDALTGVPTGDLSETEAEGLISMREEEKLARDVYRTMFEVWGVKIFDNISYSENRHSLAVKELLDRYNIEDPVKDDTTGVFTIPAMQDLYDSLVAQGSTSLLEALKVGATIEDLDIYDLNNWISNTDNEDIVMVYENLIRGSRNHMRSFDKQIVKNDGVYTAQYLSQAQIDEILAGDQEQGGHGDSTQIKDKQSGQQGNREGRQRARQ